MEERGEDGINYLKSKRRKLDIQFAERTNSGEDYLKGLRIYVSGFSPSFSAAEGKRITSKLGARYTDVVTSKTTHFVCDFLPDSKAAKALAPLKSKSLLFVKPEWLKQCEIENRRVPETTYALVQLEVNPTVDFFEPDKKQVCKDYKCSYALIISFLPRDEKQENIEPEELESFLSMCLEPDIPQLVERYHCAFVFRVDAGRDSEVLPKLEVILIEEYTDFDFRILIKDIDYAEPEAILSGSDRDSQYGSSDDEVVRFTPKIREAVVFALISRILQFSPSPGLIKEVMSTTKTEQKTITNILRDHVKSVTCDKSRRNRLNSFLALYDEKASAKIEEF